MTAVEDTEFQTLEIFSATRGAERVAQKLQRRSAARAEAASAAPAELG